MAEQEDRQLREGYVRALERALEAAPARNGVVSIRDLWLETALPLDLIEEILRDDGVRLPPHVVRVDVKREGKKGKHGRK